MKCFFSFISAEAQVMGPQDETKEITKLPNSTKQPYITSASPLPDVVVKVDPAASGSHAEQETFLSIGLQVLLPFLVAGMGMVGAGIYLDHVQVRLVTSASYRKLWRTEPTSSVLLLLHDMVAFNSYINFMKF